MIRLKVTELDPEAVAAKAGVQVGDFLDKYDNTDLDFTETLISTVSKSVGGAHTLRIIRGKEVSSLTCGAGRLGVTVEQTDVNEGDYYRLIQAYEKQRDAEKVKALNSIILTTANNIDGYTAEVIDIITSECAFGMNIFKDFFSAVSDVFGGRSGSTQKVLQDARKTCLKELRREAARLGADGVIAVNLDYSEFSGAGKSMLFLVASGTAVKITKV